MSRVLPVVAALFVISCGGSPTQPTPQPQPTPAPTNAAPTITSMSVSPSFGISQLSIFTFSASATDSNGDALTYSWDLGAGATNGQNLQGPINSWGTFTVRLTVTDGKGGTATDTRLLTVGSMEGRWTGQIPGYTNLIFDLRQTGNVITGTFFEQFFGSGQVDPAQPGRIETNGAMTMRVKLSVFTDFNFTGTMDSSGRRIAGGVFGSGFNGQPFTMNKQ